MTVAGTDNLDDEVSDIVESGEVKPTKTKNTETKATDTVGITDSDTDLQGGNGADGVIMVTKLIDGDGEAILNGDNGVNLDVEVSGVDETGGTKPETVKFEDTNDEEANVNIELTGRGVKGIGLCDQPEDIESMDLDTEDVTNPPMRRRDIQKFYYNRRK